jgi:GxxExxY protein
MKGCCRDAPLALAAAALIACAIEVHRRLGPGLKEAIYQDAMTIELEIAGSIVNGRSSCTIGTDHCGHSGLI